MQPSNTNRLLTSHFRCPEDLADFTVAPIASSDSGYFRFGSDAIIYGQSSSGIPAALVTDACPIACQHVDTNESTVQLPFDPEQVVDNLRFERYAANSTRAGKKVEPKNVLRNLYYSVRPFMPVAVRKHLQ